MRANEFVQSYFDAWNHSDPVAVADHLSTDGIYWNVPENIHRSHDELIVELRQFFAAERHRYELIGDILEGPSTIAFQYRMCPLDGVADEPYQGAEFIALHGDAAVTIYDYYNVPVLLQPIDLPRVEASPRRAAAKYAKSGLSDEQLAGYKKRLDFVMRAEQAYLRSDLTLPRLARLIDCSVNHLSQVINAGFGVSFFDYLNRFRVEHARELLAEADGQSSAVLNIAFTVGFNSNSAFYAAFKKHVGQTPAQYRRAQAGP